MRDPVMFEIVKNAFTTVGQEMGLAVVRSAYSSMMKEGSGDGTSGAVFDRNGYLLTGPYLLHMSSLRPTLFEILKDYPLDSLKDGDVFLSNHPYRGGIHSNDMMLFRPVFFDGKLSFFTAAIMHVADIGGMSAGGLPATATEMYHEGLVLPPVKLQDGGKPQELIKILEANSRTPEKVIGDIRALLAAANVGADRLIDLIHRYGYEELLGIGDEMIDYSETRTRHEITQLPDGVYTGSFVIDDDGIENKPEGHTVRVTVTIDGSTFHADFTGTDPQARGPINSPIAESTAGVMFVLRCFIDPTIPMNEGCYRPLTVTFPQGTLVNPRPPAALNSRMATVMAMMDSMLRALSPAFPGKSMASSSNISVYTMNGTDAKTHRIWTFMDPNFGGVAARSVKDGVDVTGALIFGGGGVGQTVEPHEIEYPVQYKRVQLWKDSGGPGKWRGGLGLRREIQILTEGQVTARIADRSRMPPAGAEGGQAGKGGGWVVNMDDAEETVLPGKVTNYHLKAGDTFTTLTSGSGGYGPAWERDKDLVLKDVREQKVTPESAQRDYGVFIDPESMTIDDDETQRLRAALASRTGNGQR